MDSNDTLLTCLAKKKDISIPIRVQPCHHSNNIIEEMNSSLRYVHHGILQSVDQNHLKYII